MRSLLTSAISLALAGAAVPSLAAEEPAAAASAPTDAAAKPIRAQLAIVGRDANVSEHFTPHCLTYDSKAIPPGSTLVVVRKVTCNKPGGLYERIRYEVLYKGEKYLAESKHFPSHELWKGQVDGYTDEQVEANIEQWKLKSLEVHLAELEGAKKALLATKKIGVALVRSGIHDISEHTQGTGASFVIANTGTKTIKYVTVNYVGLNAVNDPVPTLRGTASIRGIGPIEPGRTASYSRDYVWMTDSVQTHRVSSIAVEFMDGTKRTVTDIKAISLSPLQSALVLEDE